jgi:SAM-dependent methyltransferase
MRDPSYQGFKGVFESPDAAQAYRDERFSRSRRWRWTDRRERSLVEGFLSALPRGARLLDLPCGSGRLVPLFQKAKMGFVGADVAWPMLRLARQWIGEPALIKADALALPFRRGAFDGVISVRLLHRIRERELRGQMLREMARVTRGPILVTYYARWNVRGIQRWLRGKYPGLSLEEMRRDALEAGLRVSRATPLRRWTQQQWFLILEREPPAVTSLKSKVPR